MNLLSQMHYTWVTQLTQGISQPGWCLFPLNLSRSLHLFSYSYKVKMKVQSQSLAAQHVPDMRPIILDYFMIVIPKSSTLSELTMMPVIFIIGLVCVSLGLSTSLIQVLGTWESRSGYTILTFTVLPSNDSIILPFFWMKMLVSCKQQQNLT